MNSQRTRDINELKKQAIQFYTENSDITKKVEDALNCLFYDSPYDVYGYLSEFFVRYSKAPFFTKINAKRTIFYDTKCQPTFKLELFCQVKNIEKKILSIEAPCFSYELINESVKIQSIQEDDEFRANKLNDILSFVNSEINNLIRNYSPFDQEELDEKLRNLFKLKHDQFYQAYITSLNLKAQSGVSQVDLTEGKKSKTPTSPKQKGKNRKASQAPGFGNNSVYGEDLNILLNSNFYGSFIEPLLSKSFCICSSIASNRQAFEIICELKQNKIDKFSMPIPMITVLHNGKGFNGKQNLIKEYILLPKPNLSVQEGVELISKINRALRDNFYQSKSQPGATNKCVTELGAYITTLETPQQGLELIENTIISSIGSDAASKISVALNICANEFYDNEKNKYEISSGILKSTDELVDIFADLIAKFPRIMMIIEPFNNNDQYGFYKLYTRISKYCLIANNIKLNDISETETEKTNLDLQEETPATPVENKLPEVLKPSKSIVMPVCFYKFEIATNVSHIGNLIRVNNEKNIMSGLSCSINETDDDFLADLSVGNQVKFFKIGGFNRSERVNKINRLIDIENYLAENQKLLDPKSESRDINFSPHIDIPADIIEMITASEEAKNLKTPKK